jgi:hypothetical protein
LSVVTSSRTGFSGYYFLFNSILTVETISPHKKEVVSGKLEIKSGSSFYCYSIKVEVLREVTDFEALIQFYSAVQYDDSATNSSFIFIFQNADTARIFQITFIVTAITRLKMDPGSDHSTRHVSLEGEDPGLEIPHSKRKNQNSLQFNFVHILKNEVVYVRLS